MKHHTPSAITIALLLCLPATDAQEKTAHTVDLLGPDPTTGLSGNVAVRVGISVNPGKRAPSAVYASLGGSPGVRLNRVGDSGEWGGEIDTTLVPNGTQQLELITNDNGSKVTVPVTVENPLRHFFADLHSHTGFSDGSLLPEVAHDYARDVARLDVFCLTDHLESVDAGEWNRIREVAWKANEDGAFVVLPGLEWTKEWGHINIYDPGTRHWPDDPPKVLRGDCGSRRGGQVQSPG